MKKLGIVALLAVGGFLLLRKKGNTELQNEIEETENNVSGFRELTDTEAQNYLNQNSDLLQAFGNDLEKAKWHWRVQGFPFEFENGSRKNPYLI